MPSTQSLAPRTRSFGGSGKQVSSFTCLKQPKEKQAWLTVKARATETEQVWVAAWWHRGPGLLGAGGMQGLHHVLWGPRQQDKGPGKLPGRRWASG